MKTFFKSIKELDQFTANLDYHRSSIKCGHCDSGEYLVSHGYSYKDTTTRYRITGKRLFCSPRYGRKGCGKTQPLYVADTMPSLRYSAVCISIFITLLLNTHSIEEAYHFATNCADSRNAYRWLNKLEKQLVRYRTFIVSFGPPFSHVYKHRRSKRLNILLPTLQQLSDKHPFLFSVKLQLMQQKSYF